jgi:hypothetical protein
MGTAPLCEMNPPPLRSWYVPSLPPPSAHTRERDLFSRRLVEKGGSCGRECNSIPLKTSAAAAAAAVDHPSLCARSPHSCSPRPPAVVPLCSSVVNPSPSRPRPPPPPSHALHTHTQFRFGPEHNSGVIALLVVSPRTLPLDTLARSCVRARGALGGRELFCANWSGFGVVCAIVEALALCRSGGEGVWRGTLWSGVVMFGIGGGVGGGEGGM